MQLTQFHCPYTSMSFCDFSLYCMMRKRLELVLTGVLYCGMVVEGEMRRRDDNQDFMCTKCYECRFPGVLGANMEGTNKVDVGLLHSYENDMLRVSSSNCFVATCLRSVLTHLSYCVMVMPG